MADREADETFRWLNRDRDRLHDTLRRLESYHHKALGLLMLELYPTTLRCRSRHRHGLTEFARSIASEGDWKNQDVAWDFVLAGTSLFLDDIRHLPDEQRAEARRKWASEVYRFFIGDDVPERLLEGPDKEPDP